MNWSAASGLFAVAVGSSLGLMFFTITYQREPTRIHLMNYEVLNFQPAFHEGSHFVKNRIEKDEVFESWVYQNDSAIHKDDDRIAQYLHDKIKVLCMVTLDTYDEKKFLVSRRLLEKRCNELIYFSLTPNVSQGIVGVDVSKVDNGFSTVANEAFRYIAKHYPLAADWFIRLDLGSYIIMENLKYFLSTIYPGDPLYFGAVSNDIYGEPQMCSAFVLSTAALEVFVDALNAYFEKSPQDPNTCVLRRDKETTDVLSCFRKLGLKSEDTTDSLGRTRMHCLNPMMEISKSYPTWFVKTNPHYRENTTGVSDYAISFGMTDMPKQEGLEYAVYHLRPVGINFGTEDLNRKSV